MHKFYVNLAWLVLAISAPAQAATEVEGELPIELARHFIGGLDIYSDLPTDFPEFAMPDGMYLMGSLDQGTDQVLILGRSVTGARAQQALAGAFTAQPGWTVLEQLGGDQTRRGFVQASTDNDAIQLPVQLCHDTLGLLTITGNYLDEVVHVRLSRPVRNRLTICEPGAQASRMMPTANNSGIAQFIPILALPANLPSDSVLDGNGSSGSPDDLVITESVQAGATSPEELHSHFAEQLRAQGWQPDGQWSGSVSTGSSWIRPPANDDEPQLFGFLEIISRSDAQTDLSFRLVAR